jgi:hypothetical protein
LVSSFVHPFLQPLLPASRHLGHPLFFILIGAIYMYIM